VLEVTGDAASVHGSVKSLHVMITVKQLNCDRFSSDTGKVWVKPTVSGALSQGLILL
jgi:hypothetical protein